MNELSNRASLKNVNGVKGAMDLVLSMSSVRLCVGNGNECITQGAVPEPSEIGGLTETQHAFAAVPGSEFAAYVSSPNTAACRRAPLPTFL